MSTCLAGDAPAHPASSGWVDRAVRIVSRWRCPACGYIYDEQAGHPHEGFPAGTLFSEVPDDWACPDCGVRDKVDFERDEEE